MSNIREVRVEVEVDFDAVVQMAGPDDFNAYICGLTGEEFMQDIGWEILGGSGFTIRLMVTGWVDPRDE